MSSNLFRRVLFAAWGMGTLILVFCVVLLVVLLARRTGEAPPNGTVKAAAAAPEVVHESTEKGAAKQVKIFFADSEYRGLVAEPVEIEFSDYTVENCHKALDALIKGPASKLSPIMPPSTKIRGLYLMEDGELVIDFSLDLERDLKNLRSAGLESLLFYGIADSLAQPELKGSREPEVSKVRFLIEGAAPRESFPAHMDVSVPITADPQWILAKKE